MALVARSSFESGFIAGKPNQFFIATNRACGILDDGVFKFGNHSARLAQEVYKRQGDAAGSERAASVASGFEEGRSAISGTRLIFPIVKLFSGQMFWAVDSEGWKRDDEGNYVVRSWDEILVDVSILGARVLSHVSWLHHLKAIDLGHHAKRFTHAILALWTLVCSVTLVQSIRDCVQSQDRDKLRDQIWDIIQAFFDLIALPFDFGIGYELEGVPIAGAVLNIASSLSQLLHEVTPA